MFKNYFKGLYIVPDISNIHCNMPSYKGSDSVLVKVLGYCSEGQWFKPQYCQDSTVGPLSKAFIMADPVLLCEEKSFTVL